jgi:predicted metal-binding membrane protein
MSGMDIGVSTRPGSFGSFTGLWLVMMVTLGVMSITWMAVIAVLVLAQKLLPVKSALILRWR